MRQQREAKPDRMRLIRQRASKVRAAINSGERGNFGDRNRIARNLYDAIKALTEHDRMMPHRVLELSGFPKGNETDSTKRLDTYWLPPDYSDRHADRIAKTPKKYIAFSKALAKLDPEGRTEDEALCSLFRGTDFGSGQTVEEDWDHAAWSSLANRIEAMVSAVDRNGGCAEHWQQVGKLNGQYNGNWQQKGSIEISGQPLDVYSWYRGIDSDITVLDEIPPLPSTKIGETLLTPAFYADGHIEGVGNAKLEVRVYLEVRLAMIPSLGLGGQIAPFLQMRTRTDARHEELGWLDFDHKYPDIDYFSSVAFIDGARREVNFLTLDPYASLNIEDYRDGFEHYYWAHRPVSPALLKELFGGDEHYADLTPGNFVMEGRKIWSDAFSVSSDFSSRFRTLSPAGILDAHLASGVLEKELLADLERCKSIVDEYRNRLLCKIETEEAEQLHRWKSRQGEAPQQDRGKGDLEGK